MNKRISDYDQENPLGGPAKVFEAMALAVRAGDEFEHVLTQFGFTQCQPGHEHWLKNVREFENWVSTLTFPRREDVYILSEFRKYVEQVIVKTEQLENQAGEPVGKDAEELGSRLNDAAWAAIEAWDTDVMGPMTGEVFNNIKAVVRAAILKYCEGHTTPPAQPVQPAAAINEEMLKLLKVSQEITDRLRPYNERLCKVIAEAEFEIENAAETEKARWQS